MHSYILFKKLEYIFVSATAEKIKTRINHKCITKHVFVTPTSFCSATYTYRIKTGVFLSTISVKYLNIKIVLVDKAAGVLREAMC